MGRSMNNVIALLCVVGLFTVFRVFAALVGLAIGYVLSEHLPSDSHDA